MELENEIVGEEQEVNEPVESYDADDGDSGVSEDDNAEHQEGEGEQSDDASDDGIDKEMKTIKKALNKKNRYIDNQRSRIRSLEGEIQKLQTSMNTGASDAPQMEQYESVLDYMEAKQKHDLEQKFAEQGQQQQLTHLQQQQMAVRQQQDQQIETEINELVDSSPEVKSVFEENLAVIEQMPPHIEALMYEVDAVAAGYALAKEGRLQDLYSMHPHVAAAELVQAQHRGRQYLEQSSSAPSISKAPKPIASARGSGTNSKPLDKRSPDELMKWLNS